VYHTKRFVEICGDYLTHALRPTYASPAPKANDDLARATFYTDCAKVKNGLALGVRVYAIVRPLTTDRCPVSRTDPFLYSFFHSFLDNFLCSLTTSDRKLLFQANPGFMYVPRNTLQLQRTKFRHLPQNQPI
jgi:hypothetical protein